ITLVGGSISERREGREKLSNTCVVVDPQGDIAAVYRKIHLFDVEAGGVVYRESDAEEPGEEPVVAELEGWPVGLTVCYDLRFPELYRILALEGALLFTVPAHFTLYTGRDHWELLLRARAVENQCYVAAAAQIGETLPGRQSYGRASIVDPWGVVLAQAPDEETVIAAELDRARLEAIRARFPSLASRRRLDLDPALYEPARLAALDDLRRHPELDHDEEIWIRFTEDIIRGMGGAGDTRELALEIVRRWEQAAHFELYEDALPVLSTLREHGLRLGLVSNTSRDLGAFVRHFGLDVDGWVASGTHGKVKPSPLIFQAALELVGASAATTTMVG